MWCGVLLVQEERYQLPSIGGLFFLRFANSSFPPLVVLVVQEGFGIARGGCVCLGVPGMVEREARGHQPFLGSILRHTETTISGQTPCSLCVGGGWLRRGFLFEQRNTRQKQGALG